MMFDMKEIKAVVGTNSWGSKVYGKLLRGSYVDETVINTAVKRAMELGLYVFDTAQDYGMGKCQPMLGRLAGHKMLISAKYTPLKKYKKGSVIDSLEKDLKELNRDYVDIYWLHLPNSIEDNLAEIIELYKEGKVKNIGISNFSLEECKLAKNILEKADIPLYGVQNHYSIISRKWEEEGLLDWCKENDISFWGWAVLEEGILVGPPKNEKRTLMKAIFSRQRKKLSPLFEKMELIGKKYDLTIAQVAMSFVASKGIIPICGCRKPYQVEQLSKAANVQLSPEEIESLEKIADQCGAKVLGADIFRVAVKK